MLQLTNPPIVEAVVDINCDLPIDTDLLKLQESAKEVFRDFYPKTRRQMSQRHEFHVEVEKPTDRSVRQDMGALQFLTEDEKQLVQMRPEGYSFNRLAPYGSMDDYLPEIERTWEVFRQLVHPVQIRRVGLRFINRILLPTIGRKVELSEYLRVSPHLPDEGALEFIGFLNQHSAVEVRTGNRVNITMLARPLEGDRLPLIFDIDTFSPVIRQPEAWKSVRTAISSLRNLSNRVFENTLTPKCLNLFQQQ